MTADRLINFHRVQYDYEEQHQDILMPAYEDRKFEVMERQINDEEMTDTLRVKILKEINEDFRSADKILLAFMTSELIHTLTQLLTYSNEQIRELVTRALVLLGFCFILRRSSVK